MNDNSQKTAPVQAIMDDQVNSSALIRALGAKIAEGGQVPFDYFCELNRLAKEVAPQIAQIPRTFPEYTPHDWHLHVRRLFGVADRLIGEERYASMLPAELFVFAASLFAHDWGMAVSDAERDAIVAGGKTPNGATFRLLDNETAELRNFARDKGLEIKPDGSCPALREDGYWREYVRATHAWRSGLRAQRFFEQTDGGVAQAVAAACEGHWLDLSVIDAETRFPAFLNVRDQRINLRAVVIYVRLVDLFDIGEDRTPYALWLFVGPRDNKSATEWSKHRALRPINVESYQPGRRVVVDGTASEPDLWAALLDLRDYIEQQLRGCMDLMARHPDARHTLDLAPVVRWSVKALGFEPIQLRFEFDRTRMFEILSDEIYQGDCYVFLRELLQNSIDAIRVRRAKQALRPQDGIAEGLIEFKVIHGKDGDATVTCRDNGIGMDEYILRNYLAVAGVSYYRSDDFSREGLNIDPISRFGVGILSCFMVADSIELTSYRDPRFYPATKPLRVVVPAIDKQFHVFPASPDSDVGTEVVVNVRGAKINKPFAKSRKPGETPQLRLRVTDYLVAIAGFAEFPILVEEDDKKTLILHPDANASEMRGRYGNVQVRQLSRDFPWEQYVVPQDLADAKEVLTTKTLGIKADLGLAEFEGWVTFVVPKNPTTDFAVDDEFTPTTGNVTVRWQTRRHHWSRTSERLSSSSSSHPPSLAVYQNGILVPDQKSPDANDEVYEHDEPLPGPRWRVGLRSASSGRPDISRRTLVDAAERWQRSLRAQLVQKLWETEAVGIQRLSARERFIALGQFTGTHHLSPAEILPFISDLLPFPFLEKDGSVKFFDKLPDCEAEIRMSPPDVDNWLEKNSEVFFDPSLHRKTRLKAWRGAHCLINLGKVEHSAILTAAFALVSSAIKAKFHSAGFRFLTPPRRGDAFLLQALWRRGKAAEADNFEELLATLATTDSPIGQAQLVALTGSSALPSLLENSFEFESPFERFFAFGSETKNLCHPTMQALLRCHLAFHLARKRQTFSPEKLGEWS
ncbi:MAG TPA: ATP-binding protein, partial [Pyrinomonadaceae bacterium]|nr:ATP-binding protein [Pyrinomonadaceae bacterium]